METNLILEGFKFMGLGMGIVFTFLIVLIVFMNIMSTIVHKFFPEPHQSPDAPAAAQKDNKKIIAAITAAIAHHRQG